MLQIIRQLYKMFKRAEWIAIADCFVLNVSTKYTVVIEQYVSKTRPIAAASYLMSAFELWQRIKSFMFRYSNNSKCYYLHVCIGNSIGVVAGNVWAFHSLVLAGGSRFDLKMQSLILFYWLVSLNLIPFVWTL